MSEKLSWVLTDIENRQYVENWCMTPSALGLRNAAGCEGGWSITKTRLKGGVSDGVDVIDVNNGRLSFTIVPTRGMGLWRGNCDGNFIGWDSPARFPVNPNQINIMEQGGLGWLKGFNECVVRCGLNSNGAPGIDRVRDNNGNIAEVMLTLHGYIATIPACYVEVQVIPGDPTELVIIGVVEESRCFCPQYRLTTRYSTFVGSNKLSIKDQVLNFADSPTEFEMLYHCNFGSPYLEGGSSMVAPVKEIAPRDARAAEDIDSWPMYRAPEAGYIEQCYFVDMMARKDGSSLAMLRNAAGDKGTIVRFNKNQLPCFSQWKHTTGLNEGYVTGLEPATNYPNQKCFERERGRVITLQPQQTYTIDLGLEFVSDAASVAAVEAEVKDIMGGQQTIVDKEPVAKWSAL